MVLNNYLKSCSKILLRKICELSKDKILEEYYKKYDELTGDIEEVDYTWCLISTALLLSETLWENESLYKNITQKSIDNIVDKLMEGKNPYKGDKDYCNNSLLDKHNNVANPIYINEVQDVFNLDDREMTIYRINKNKNRDDLESYEKSTIDFLDNIFENDVYGVNAALITDERIDYRKFIIRVRHALAHSNYEIVNNDFIRLYHYNNESKLDFNVAVKKNLVLTILDELNELYYFQGKEFEYNWFLFRRIYNVDKTKKLYENSVVEQLLTYKSFTKKDCVNIIKEAKKNKNYSNSVAADKLDIIYESFLEKVRPVCSYGIITNEILYGNNNGLIDEEYYKKFYTYNYFNSEYFDINMNSDTEFYKKHILELLIFSYLNCVILNSVNINNNELLVPIDFSKMQIADKYLLGRDCKKLENDLNNKLNKLLKELVKIKKSVDYKYEILTNHEHIKNQYYEEKLPLEIFEYHKKIAEINLDIQYLRQSLSVVELTGISNNILNHLRNCLAHGYIRIIDDFNPDNICAIKLEFADYNPTDKCEETFKGIINLGDLIEVLTQDNITKKQSYVRKK